MVVGKSYDWLGMQYFMGVIVAGANVMEPFVHVLVVKKKIFDVSNFLYFFASRSDSHGLQAEISAQEVLPRQASPVHLPRRSIHHW